MDLGVLFFLLFPSSLGVAFLVFGLERWRPIRFRRFVAENLTTPGPVRITGVASPRAAMLDPVYERPCAFYDIVVCEPSKGGGLIWREQSGGLPFDVEDKA